VVSPKGLQHKSFEIAKRTSKSIFWICLTMGYPISSHSLSQSSLLNNIKSFLGNNDVRKTRVNYFPFYYKWLRLKHVETIYWWHIAVLTKKSASQRFWMRLVMLSNFTSCGCVWLVVDLPLWKIWVRQLGWLFPIYGNIKFMFQTTNQLDNLRYVYIYIYLYVCIPFYRLTPKIFSLKC